MYENLRTVRNYSLMTSVVTMTVYRQIERGDIECVTIDGVKFIKLTDKEMEELK